MIFINNKYTRIYYEIVRRAQSRSLCDNIYTENHHIIPRSLGGFDSKENLVDLTAREHFICHWLLTKMTEGNNRAKMVYACKMMMHSKSTNQKRYTPKQYETKKKVLNEKLKNRIFTKEWKEKLRGKKEISLDEKERRSVLLRNLNKSRKGEKKAYMSGDKNCFTREEVKQKSKKTLLKKYGVENPSLVPWTCEYCKKEGKGLAGYKRWHGESCRNKQ